MGYTKDLWTRPDPTGVTKNGKPVRVRTARWGNGKRWLACWLDPDGAERTKAFRTQTDANAYWQAMETDKQRGDYHDPNAGKVLFGALGKRWITSRVCDPATLVRYESVYRLHVEPVFGRRQVRTVTPSEIQAWLGQLAERFEPSTPIAAFLVLQGIFNLAAADKAIKTSPAKSSIIQRPRHQAGEIQAWPDGWVNGMIDAHPEPLRCMPQLGASCGLREGEIFGLAVEDFDFDNQVLRVRRQIKYLNGVYVYALPKNDRERIVPLADWTIEAVQQHLNTHPAREHTLPWEKPDGPPRTHTILFRWPVIGAHVHARTYSEQIWKPALVKVGIIPAPSRTPKPEQPGRDGKRRTRLRYATTRRQGTHQLRHYYASITLAGGVSIKELAEYLGHTDPAFTLRRYAHMLPSSHQRARDAIHDHFARTEP
ncbi:tyrosine-type recombinase/integrase [Nonomuraea sp. NPDC059007]|uniref:tyrosine-type recombinase/integrase n=1 Tax=Nonomuraea sp. NPDC059007 TaxID=3346692 RepID=UPI0036CC404B